jgi:type II secretory pathway pseudopilin PulG
MINRVAKQSGDTIVEVMVAMVILMMVLVGAYVTANRSMNSERDAQEHAEALTIAQGQVEDLHAGYQLTDSGGGSNLCFNSTNPALSTGGQNCYENSNGNFCQALSDDSNCLPSSAYWYQIQDSQILPEITLLSTTHPPLMSPTYEVLVSWPNINGATDTVQLYYRPE